MTVQEANEYLKQLFEELEQYRALGTPKEIKIREVSSAQLGKAYLSNLTELREYQSLGTVEELKEARKKQVAKKPIIWENKSIDSPIPNDDWGYECPCCGNRDIDYPEHHCECGQALKWSEEDD